MKKFSVVILLIGVFSGIIFIVKNVQNSKISKLSVERNGSSIFVGEKNKALNNIDNGSDYVKQIQKIDQAHEYIQKGDLLFKQGQFSRAAEEYRNAYLIKNAGSNAVSGSLLVEVYEKLGHYDEGIATIDDMIKSGYLSKNGLREMIEIRAHLLAAKSQANSRDT